jgi:ribosomal protein L40E
MMRCSKCGAGNPLVNNFCVQCGNALTPRCGKCGAENDPASNFCGKCGTPLAKEATLISVTPPPAESPSGVRLVADQSDPSPTTEGERKTVTVLFADIKGSTELMRDLDPEEARAGFLYLAVVLDTFSRRIVGWAMATHLRTELVLEALNMALGQRRPAAVIHHSDQGSQCHLSGITLVFTENSIRYDRDGLSC